jgi:hypothetical protein
MIHDHYDSFMQSIIYYLAGTWLAKPHALLADKGSIAGSTDDEIDAAERRIGRALPAALRAWYRVAGKVPPSLQDHDADFSLRNLTDVHSTLADHLTDEPGEPWLAPPSAVVFSVRLADQCLYVDPAEGAADDLPVYHFMFGAAAVRQVDGAFSSFMRETWLDWLEFVASNAERQTSSQRKSQAAWAADVSDLRTQLIARVHAEDVQRGALT